LAETESNLGKNTVENMTTLYKAIESKLHEHSNHVEKYKHDILNEMKRINDIGSLRQNAVMALIDKNEETQAYIK
jgi:ATP-dependent protease HslVU (ClpYQ) peptidase subunit